MSGTQDLRQPVADLVFQPNHCLIPRVPGPSWWSSRPSPLAAVRESEPCLPSPHPDSSVHTWADLVELRVLTDSFPN